MVKAHARVEAYGDDRRQYLAVQCSIAVPQKSAEAVARRPSRARPRREPRIEPVRDEGREGAEVRGRGRPLVSEQRGRLLRALDAAERTSQLRDRGFGRLSLRTPARRPQDEPKL